MDETTLLSHLEALAESLDISIRYEPMERERMSVAGGLCRIHGRRVFIIDAAATDTEKITVLAGALRRLDLSRVHLRPALRELLEQDDE